VDQSTEMWRDEQSKLLFVLSLGLHPRNDLRGLPYVKIAIDRTKDVEVRS
jgi:hypothetical protein